MFKYNETSYVSQFIQNMLRNYPVPIMPILTDAQYKYVSQTPEFNSFNYIYKGNMYKGNNILKDYIFGNQYLNITDNYIPSQSYYSTDLHEHLGNYLRNYSEYYRVNLISLYNCFSNRFVSNISLPIQQRNEDEINENEDIKVYNTWYKAGPADKFFKITCFPIRADSEYEIKIHGGVDGNITLQPVFYNGNTFIQIANNPVIFESKEYGYVNKINYKFGYEDIKNNSTIKYTDLLQNQKYLYLFVQVPKTDALRISVIEHCDFFNVINNSLLHLADVDYNVPFSDRLLEFLVGNVITHYDPIKQNITRVQKAIENIKPNIKPNINTNNGKWKEYKAGDNSNNVPPKNNIAGTDDDYTSIPGHYDTNLRIILYELFSGRGIPDFTGYVDKDVEQLLTSKAPIRTIYSQEG